MLQVAFLSWSLCLPGFAQRFVLTSNSVGACYMQAVLSEGRPDTLRRIKQTAVTVALLGNIAHRILRYTACMVPTKT